MKILFVANTDLHIKLCYLPYLKYLKEEGHEIHVATNTNVVLPFCDEKIVLPIHRTPFHFSNVVATFKLRKKIKKEQYDFISTSTPMGGATTRFAIKSLKEKPKILYTAHGFHFFKGNSRLKNVLYYSVEKYLAKFTDILVTINQEDYEVAKEKFKTDVRYIEGIGFQKERLKEKLRPREINKLKKEIGIKKEYVIIYVAEISKRKRQLYLLKTLLNSNLDNYILLLVGGNILGNKVDSFLQKNGGKDKIKVLGFREDISELLDISDLVVSVSGQEGLPINIMEAMYKNKPILVTNCRGNRDLIKNEVNGLVVALKDQEELMEAIKKMKKNKKYASYLAKTNHKRVQAYSVESVLPKYIKIYDELLK